MGIKEQNCISSHTVASKNFENLYKPDFEVKFLAFSSYDTITKIAE